MNNTLDLPNHLMTSSHSIHSTEAPTFRVLVKSVGRAKPATAAVIAAGLGVPISSVVANLYRAPSVLVDKVTLDIATNLKNLLREIGYEAEVQSDCEPIPKAPALYDVSLYLNDAGKLAAAAEKLAAFIGVSTEDAVQAIMKPPGVVMGSISPATIDALTTMIDGDAELLISAQDSARYDIFLGDISDVVLQRLKADLAHLGVTCIADSGLIAADLDKQCVENLWERYQGSGVLLIVNRAFLRFDIILQKHDSICDRQRQLIQKVADVPSDMVADVVRAAPVALLESVPFAKIDGLLSEFEKVGLAVQADLITFQVLGIQIESCRDRAQLSRVLTKLGVAGYSEQAKLPLALPDVYPELQARMILATLEDLGVQASLIAN